MFACRIGSRKIKWGLVSAEDNNLGGEKEKLCEYSKVVYGKKKRVGSLQWNWRDWDECCGWLLFLFLNIVTDTESCTILRNYYKNVIPHIIK